MESPDDPRPAGLEGAVDTRALGRTLIDTFGQGWSRGKVDLLLSVYAPQAVFVETPFSEPLRGLEAIGRYWGDVP